MSGSHQAKALAQAHRFTLARPLLPAPLMCQHRFIKHMQKRELGVEVLSEGCCPLHYFAANRSIIHCGENAPGGFAYAAINNECRNGKSSKQALEGTAPAPARRLPPEHHKVRTKGCGRLGKAIAWRADSHLYRESFGPKCPSETAQSRQRVCSGGLQPIVRSGHRGPQERGYLGDRKYVSELNSARPEVRGG